ncbi:serine/threonine protein phosphatase [Paenibacillus zeisoli]|uniref:Serine/threonine protein phosphatase n=1 Tax=Paenibacillus zeisoli TaxID=2496267 RepID=A0A3S1DAG8_9BACL|nr:PAS domain-containing protein [Paenibacillus zeisoli]RUT33427.1 serine/threonine protein phosphatase [Paenibacillus zeisoli]
MDERLDLAPCGYLSLSEDHTILTVNKTLLQLLGFDLQGLRDCHIESILTRSSRILFQLYFMPLIKLNGKIEEMFLVLQSASGTEVPVLLSAVRREENGATVHDCILMIMRRRMEYEEQIYVAEQASKKAGEELERLQIQLTQLRNELSGQL